MIINEILLIYQQQKKFDYSFWLPRYFHTESQTAKNIAASNWDELIANSLYSHFNYL